MREGGETRERAYRFLVLAKKMKVEGSTAYGKRTAFDLEAGLACSQTLRTFGGGRGTREDPCTRPASGEKERERERERERLGYFHLMYCFLAPWASAHSSTATRPGCSL